MACLRAHAEATINLTSLATDVISPPPQHHHAQHNLSSTSAHTN